MIATYEDLSPSALASISFDDPLQACRALQGMAGEGVPDAAFNTFLAAITQALEGCADPDRAVANLARWAAARRQPRGGLRAAGRPAYRRPDAGDDLRRLAVFRRICSSVPRNIWKC